MCRYKGFCFPNLYERRIINPVRAIYSCSEEICNPRLYGHRIINPVRAKYSYSKVICNPAYMIAGLQILLEHYILALRRFASPSSAI